MRPQLLVTSMIFQGQLGLADAYDNSYPKTLNPKAIRHFFGGVMVGLVNHRVEGFGFQART